MSDNRNTYRTIQIRIKPGHRFFSYCQVQCQKAKNLYNTTNFYIRQVFSAYTKRETLHPLQKEVIDIMEASIDSMNEVQRVAYEKRQTKEDLKPVEKRKPIKLNLYSLPSEETPFVSFGFLDSLFKCIKQPDYRALPAQSSQSIMKSVFQNWDSFRKSLKDYRHHPEKYKGRPNIPGYSRSHEKEVLFTNQDCVIKDGKYLKFPLTKMRLNIGKIGTYGGKLKQVRVIPSYGHYVVELVMDIREESPLTESGHRVMAIDFGMNNLATIVTNTGHPPLLVKGGAVKSINQFYNQMKAHFLGILRQGKDPKEGPFTSKRLERLHKNRHLKIKDYFHKASRLVLRLAETENIGMIVMGLNPEWKQSIEIGKRNNQSFCHIPHRQLIDMITYKAEEVGVKVKIVEESYTSKASFLDGDDIPVYGEEKEHPSFSGKRVKRGLYRSKDGTYLNADVNGAYNILRKAVPNALTDGIEGLSVYRPLVCQLR